VGKVRMAAMPPKNHWWQVPLYVDVRGLTTRRIPSRNALTFELGFDFIDHRLVLATSHGALESFELVDGLSVAEFHDRLLSILEGVGITVAIRKTPFGLPTATPFPADRKHTAYDQIAVQRFWRILDWTDHVLEEFAGWYRGKTSPVHLFWHSFDLALTRFGGRRAPAPRGSDRVTREAYSEELISFGFWPGGDDVREAMYYAYAAPEPEGLREARLHPDEAIWTEHRGGSLALLPYEAVRASAAPKATLLAFLESAYQVCADALDWDRDELASSWYPAVASRVLLTP
jgi:hypothetical protein